MFDSNEDSFPNIDGPYHKYLSYFYFLLGVQGLTQPFSFM